MNIKAAKKTILGTLAIVVLAVGLLLPAAASAAPTPIKIGWIMYGGDWNSDPAAPGNLATQVSTRTGSVATVEFVSLDDIATVKQYHMLVLMGHNQFSFSDQEREVLRSYLEDCGLLFIDDCNNAGDSGFEESVRAEMNGMFPPGLVPLPAGHPVFSAFYNLSGVPPTEWNSESLEGIMIAGSYRVIYSDNDYTCGWEDYANPDTIENSFQMGTNLAVYAAMQSYCTVQVDIDIKPGSFPNAINRGNQGNVPVAVLGSEGFDTTDIDDSTVTFGGAPPLPIGMSPQDVNGDGLEDRVLHFDTTILNLQVGDTQACLDGLTFGGQSFHGCDSVRIVK